MAADKKTCLVFCNGVLKHVNSKGKVIATINLHKLDDKVIKQHYPQHYFEYLELLDEPF
jgi:hypothetical protein